MNGAAIREAQNLVFRAKNNPHEFLEFRPLAGFTKKELASACRSILPTAAIQMGWTVYASGIKYEPIGIDYASEEDRTIIHTIINREGEAMERIGSEKGAQPVKLNLEDLSEWIEQVSEAEKDLDDNDVEIILENGRVIARASNREYRFTNFSID